MEGNGGDIGAVAPVTLKRMIVLDTEENPYEDFYPKKRMKEADLRSHVTSGQPAHGCPIDSSMPVSKSTSRNENSSSKNQGYTIFQSEEAAYTEPSTDANGAGCMDEDGDDASKTENTVELTYICQGPGCMEEFPSILQHDAHYNSRHRNICSVCKKSLRSQHLLDLHVMEKHDSYFAVLSERKPMYQCLIEKCDEKFKGPDERLVHCIEKHPSLRKHLLHQVELKKMLDREQEMAVDDDKSPGTSTVSESEKKKSNSIPNSGNPRVNFGQRHPGGRFIPRQAFAMQKKGNNQKENAETEAKAMDLSELKDSLQ